MSNLINNAVNVLKKHVGTHTVHEELLSEQELFEEAAAPDDEIPEGMPKNVHDFMFHLSGPSDPTGDKKGSISLNEAKTTLFDISRGDRPGEIQKPSAEAHKNMGLPKTAAMIDTARQEGLGEKDNLHKKIGAGFRSTFGEMQSEHPTVTRQKLREAKTAFRDFARSRGLKAKTPPAMMGGNMKTEKSSGEGVLTTGLNLAPHATSGLHGFDVCPNASSDCRKNCLGTEAGGNRQYPDAALSSKVLRTHFVAAHPEHAARIIDHEISLHKKKAQKAGMIPGVRMNVTSDISWEHHAPQLFERHKDVQFYDYTKLHNRVLRSLAPKKEGSHFNSMGHPSNYHLTLSHTGSSHGESNDKAASEVLKRGGVVAMVFQRGKKSGGLPSHVVDHATGKKYPVANGDDDDNTFDRHTTLGRTEGQAHQGVVSGLMLKGVKNEDAGSFANKVESGESHINKPATVSEQKMSFIKKIQEKRALKESSSDAMISFRQKVDAKRLVPSRSGSKGGDGGGNGGDGNGG
jgi:hypothetical protein